MKYSLNKLIVVSCLFLNHSVSTSITNQIANRPENRGYPYGCENSSTYVQKIGEWKFRCYTDCSCMGQDNLYIDEEMLEQECLEKVITVPQAVGANVGGNKCHIIINKCIDFKNDTKTKAPYCSKYKGY